MKLILHIDGASRGNPGLAAIGVLVAHEDGTVLAEISEYIGETTNNVAEYKALLRGLEEAGRLNAKELSIYSDSELLVKQVNGEYHVRHRGLLPLYEQVQNMIPLFRKVSLTHVPRKQNTCADKLANEALDQLTEKKVPAKEASCTDMRTRAVIAGLKGKPQATLWGSLLQRLSVPQVALTELRINSGQEFSYHEIRADAVFCVLSGSGDMIVADDRFDLQAGACIFVARDSDGTVKATHEEPLTVLMGLIPNPKGEDHESVDGI